MSAKTASPVTALYQSLIQSTSPADRIILLQKLIEIFIEKVDFTKPLLPDNKLALTIIAQYAVNFFNITIRTDNAENLAIVPDQLKALHLKLSADPVHSIPPNLQTLLADWTRHQQEMRQELLTRTGVRPDQLDAVARLQEEITRVSGHDEVGQAIAFTAAAELAQKGPVSSQELETLLIEKTTAAGLPPPPPNQIAALHRQIKDTTASFTPVSSRPPITTGVPKVAQVVTQAQRLAAAEPQAAQAPKADRPISSVRTRTIASIAIASTKPPKHLEKKVGEELSGVIEKFLGALDQGTLAFGKLDFRTGSLNHSQLKAFISSKAMELGVPIPREAEIGKMIEAAVNVKLPASTVVTGQITYTPEELAELEARFPAHLGQYSLFKTWFAFQVLKLGKGTLEKELDKSLKVLKEETAAKQAAVTALESKLEEEKRKARETPVAAAPTGITDEIAAIKPRLKQARLDRAEHEKELRLQLAQRDILSRQITVGELDRKIAEISRLGTTPQQLRLLYQKRQSVFAATHEVVTDKATLTAQDTRKILDSLKASGYLDSAAGQTAQGWHAAAKSQNEVVVSFEQFQDFQEQLSQRFAAIGKPLPGLDLFKNRFFRKNLLGRVSDFFPRKNVAFLENFGFLPRAINTPKNWVLRLTGNRFGSLSHLFKTGYNKTFGRLLSAFTQKGVGKTLATKAAVWLGAKLGIRLAAWAAGLASGPGVVVIAALEAGKFIFNKIKDFLVAIKRKPEKLAVPLIALGAVLLLAGASPGLTLLPFLLAGGLLIPAGLAAAGPALAGLGAGVTAVSSAFMLSASGPGVAVLVAGVIGGLAVLTLFVVIIISAAFVLPVVPGEIAPQDIFTVTKTVSDKEIANDELPTSVVYQITVTADQEILIGTIIDKREITCRGTPPTLSEPIVNFPPPAVPVTEWISPEYELNFPDDTYQNCRVCNTVTVTASLADGSASGLTATDSVCVKIGDPPEDCPDGWPTDHGVITQGPLGSYSHTKPYDQEAIDIGGTLGVEAHSTFAGRVSSAGPNPGCGSYQVTLEGTCGTTPFSVKYLHLASRGLAKEDDLVNPGDVIGYVGPKDTCSNGAHLHYEFVGLLMGSPYIPVDREKILYCIDRPGCGVSW